MKENRELSESETYKEEKKAAEKPVFGATSQLICSFASELASMTKKKYSKEQKNTWKKEYYNFTSSIALSMDLEGAISELSDGEPLKPETRLIVFGISVVAGMFLIKIDENMEENNDKDKYTNKED